MGLQVFIYFTCVLQNELCRMRLDVSMLDELVREYCIYRGIVDSGIMPSSGEFQNFVCALRLFVYIQISFSTSS